MGAFGDAMRGANISGEIREDDEDLVATLTKLKSITEMFLSVYDDMVVEILATPMDLINRKLSDINKIVIYVVYSDSADKETVSYAKEMLSCLAEDEFDMVKGGVDIVFSLTYKINVAMLCLYSVFPVDVIGPIETGLPTNLYLIFADLVLGRGYTISFPVNVVNMTPKTIYVHCGEADKVVQLNTIMDNYGMVIKQYSDKLKVKDCDIIYVPMLQQSKLAYGLPYVYVDQSSFDRQHLDSILNAAKD